MNIFGILILILLLIIAVMICNIFKLRKIVDHYKYEDDWAWPQYDRQGSWKDTYKSKMTLLGYINSLEREREILGKILTNKIYDHVGHPFNERVNMLRSVIRDLKLMYNQQTNTETFKKIKDEAFYERTFWINK